MWGFMGGCRGFVGGLGPRRRGAGNVNLGPKMVYEAVTTRGLLCPSEQAEAYRSIWIGLATAMCRKLILLTSSRLRYKNIKNLSAACKSNSLFHKLEKLVTTDD